MSTGIAGEEKELSSITETVRQRTEQQKTLAAQNNQLRKQAETLQRKVHEKERQQKQLESQALHFGNEITVIQSVATDANSEVANPPGAAGHRDDTRRVGAATAGGG